MSFYAENFREQKDRGPNRSGGTAILHIRGTSDSSFGCGGRPAVTVLMRRRDLDGSAVRHMRNLVLLRPAQAGSSLFLRLANGSFSLSTPLKHHDEWMLQLPST